MIQAIGNDVSGHNEGDLGLYQTTGHTGLEKLDLCPLPEKQIASWRLDREHAQSTFKHSDVDQTAGPRAQITT